MLRSFGYRAYQYILLIMGLSLLLSCKKDHILHPDDPPVLAEKHILLKDISIPRLPAPYYHFEYNGDSLVTKASFASNYTMYDVLYSGGKISEMRNNILVNHDTLRYSYDHSGKLSQINFIDDDNIVYRHAFFTYDRGLLKEIKWDHQQPDGSFFNDRTLSFTYYADGNVQTITDHRPPVPDVADYVSIQTFEEYDDKVNVDDFTLVHDGIHDHLFLLQGFRLQKGNPKKEMLAVNGTDLYTIDYAYTYNEDDTPSNKAGDFLYLSGQYAGRRFKTNTFYTYY